MASVVMVIADPKQSEEKLKNEYIALRVQIAVFAVLQTGKVQVSGFLAWLTWAAKHLQFLATSSVRLSVFLQWVWTYVTGQRGDRQIMNHHGAEYAKAAADATVKPALAGR